MKQKLYLMTLMMSTALMACALSTRQDEPIARFMGGSGEQTYETRVWEDDGRCINYYESYTNTTDSYGSSEHKAHLDKKGWAMAKEEFVSIAKDHGAGSLIREDGTSDFAEAFLNE